MKEHYKSDLHKQNILRRTENYQPLSEQQLAERELSAASSTQRARTKGRKEKKRYGCGTCGKSFSSQKAYDQHIKASGHAPMPAKVIEGEKHPDVPRHTDKDLEGLEDFDMSDDEWVDAMYDEEAYLELMATRDPIAETRCLFCPEEFETKDAARHHMTHCHGFHVADEPYCSDKEGLFDFLSKKVGQGHFCVYCGRVFKQLKDVQQHMVGKHHCRMRYRDDLDYEEYEHFYDYERKNEAMDRAQLHVKHTGELVLGNGRTVGTREYRNVYRQALRITAPGADELAARQESALVQREAGIARMKRDAMDDLVRQKHMNRAQLAFEVRAHKLQTYKRLYK